MFADMPTLIWVHFLTALVAVPVGLHQLVAAKGTPVHRLMGWIYVPVMLVSLLTALATLADGTDFLFFHILALVGLWSLGSGFWNLRRWLAGGNPAHLRAHKIDMAYSWLGLFMAGVSQFLLNPRFGLPGILPGWELWVAFGLLNILLWSAGSWWIFRRLVGPRAPSGAA